MAIVNDTRDTSGHWLRTYSVDCQEFITVSGLTWRNMRCRCKVGGDFQRRRPTYIGCEMSYNFKDFQFFTNWHQNQVGYGTKGYHLDKDILLNGNKVYSENICVLVPLQLNNFLVSHSSKRGEWPQGVCFNKYQRLFQANIRVNSVSKHIGFYTTPDDAHRAYKKAKEAEAYRWYERLKDGEFLVDERVVERMRTWTFKEGVCSQ